VDLIPIVAILSVFVFAPSVVFGFIYVSKRSKLRVEELRLQKEMLELEVKKKELSIYELHEENRKLDHIINDEIRKLPGS